MNVLRFYLYVSVILVGGWSQSAFAATSEDHLEPVVEYLGAAPLYRKLWREKLLVTPGELARFVQLPGSRGVEVAVSMYKDDRKSGGLPGGYWLTMTEPSVTLSQCYPREDKSKYIDPRTIHIKRLDAPLPEATALAIRKLWLVMLNKARPGPDPETYITLDSTQQYFSAQMPDGKVFEAVTPSVPVGPNAKTDQLIRIGFLLLYYCEVRPPNRPQVARKIGAKAAALAKRVAGRRN
jgi:hypothetical protein